MIRIIAGSPSVKSVLIVDDNANVRRALHKFVEDKTDLDVSGEAADGTEAVRKARELEPDVILMDLAMPSLSGAGAAAAIKRFLPRTRIIVFSLYPDLVGRNMAQALGVDIVIDKSEGSAALTEALRNILAA